MTKWVKYCYLALFQSIYFHFWQEKGKTKPKLFYQKMPWIKELQKKVWISPKFGFVEKSKSLDFSIMLVFWSLGRNSVILAVYLLFSVACFFTVHEHWSVSCYGYICLWCCNNLKSAVPAFCSWSLPSCDMDWYDWLVSVLIYGFLSLIVGRLNCGISLTGISPLVGIGVHFIQ